MDNVHERLIALAQSAKTSAVAGKEREVGDIAIKLLTQLAIHLDDERLMLIKLDWLDPDLASSLQDRQRLVLERLFDLADESLGAAGGCRCSRLADDIVELLNEDAAAEERAIEIHELPATTGGLLARTRDLRREAEHEAPSDCPVE